MQAVWYGTEPPRPPTWPYTAPAEGDFAGDNTPPVPAPGPAAPYATSWPVQQTVAAADRARAEPPVGETAMPGYRHRPVAAARAASLERHASKPLHCSRLRTIPLRPPAAFAQRIPHCRAARQRTSPIALLRQSSEVLADGDAESAWLGETLVPLLGFVGRNGVPMRGRPAPRVLGAPVEYGVAHTRIRALEVRQGCR
jgi:hypothetical protein